ncbi:MAG: sugar phosphate isomerase/epimerase [Panacibacter sp.]
MNQSRRKFLQTSGLLGAGALLASNNLFAKEPLTNFGIQLWTVQQDMGKDAAGTLKALSSYGYKQIEGFEGGKGMFWGMTVGDMKKYMDDLGMKMISSHCNINDKFEIKAANAAAMGMKYLICPYLGPQKSIDDFKKAADNFNAKGEICKKNGIRFGYHNHGYSFQSVDGQIPEDVMIANTDPDLVDFELDMYWVVTGGADIATYLKKYKNRFRLCHIKDRQKGVDPKENDASVILGTGSIDYPSIAPMAKKYGVEYFIVEQEKFEGTTPMASAEADAKYMMTLKV